MKQRKALILAVVLLASSVAQVSSVLAETVTVTLRSGRQMTGVVDPRSDAKQLWLKYGTAAVTVLRPIAWQSVESAEVDGREIELSELQALAAKVESPQQVAATPRIVEVGPASSQVRNESMARRAQRALGFSKSVSSVQFDATLANWDGDVEMDGLLLRLDVRDGQGQPTVSTGTLQVEFVANRIRDFQHAPRRGGVTAGRIGRWTVRVDEADFRYGVATVKLPFQGVHPEFDADWFAQGLVHCKFVVAGVGTFEHSVDSVRVRPYAPSRDALQVETGRRFFPSERTGRGQRNGN